MEAGNKEKDGKLQVQVNKHKVIVCTGSLKQNGRESKKINTLNLWFDGNDSKAVISQKDLDDAYSIKFTPTFLAHGEEVNLDMYKEPRLILVSGGNVRIMFRENGDIPQR